MLRAYTSLFYLSSFSGPVSTLLSSRVILVGFGELYVVPGIKLKVDCMQGKFLFLYDYYISASHTLGKVVIPSGTVSIFVDCLKLCAKE